MDNFDLRKYLVENKVTTNSRMLTEAAEVPAWLKGKYAVIIPKETSTVAEGITFQDLENAGVDRVDLAKLEKFKNLISSLPVDQVVGFISNELKKDPAFHNNLMKKLNPSGKSTLGPMGDEDNWASAEYYKDR